MRSVLGRCVLAGALGLALVGGGYGGGYVVYERMHRRPAGPVKRRVHTPRLTPTARSTHPGEILVGASGSIDHITPDTLAWFRVSVRRWVSGGLVPVRAHAFDGVLPDGTPSAKTYTKLRRGKITPVDLPEFRVPVPVPSGRYSVFVEVLSKAPETDKFGNVRLHGMIGRSVDVDVR
jgi:hypothetical protein